jgi:hypothetical protein
VIKVYSVTFSCIYEHEKEQILSSELVSFLHKLETKLNYACNSRFNPQIFVSFFNELATERRNYAHRFHFLTSFLQRRKNYAFIF